MNSSRSAVQVTGDYSSILSRIVERAEDVSRFDEFLRSETAWLTAPASTRFHLAKPGGLVEHSVNVVRTLLILRDKLAPDIPEESCVIAGLYHDVGKVGLPGQPYYLPWPKDWYPSRNGARYIVNRDLVYMDIATRSLFLVASHLPLSPEEAQAIRYHDGQYIEENHGVAHQECKLTRLLQYADNWAGGVLEKR